MKGQHSIGFGFVVLVIAFTALLSQTGNEIIVTNQTLSNATENCDLGLIQPKVLYNTILEANVDVIVNLYNPYGENILHVLVDSADIPDGWTYSIEPEAKYYLYNTFNGTAKIYQNLAIDPVTITDNAEYSIPSKVFTLELNTPSNAVLWDIYNFSFSIIGWCVDGVSGTSSNYQTKNIQFQVRIVASEYYADE